MLLAGYLAGAIADNADELQQAESQLQALQRHASAARGVADRWRPLHIRALGVCIVKLVHA